MGFSQLLFHHEQRHLFEHIRFYNLQTHEYYLKSAGLRPLEHTGADAQYSKMLQPARTALARELYPGFVDWTDAHLCRVDQIIGRMFPTLNHTVMIASKKI